MQILKIILNQFKGIQNAEYPFTKHTIISGANGTGKTTIADAYFWLFADKDYSFKSNPEVHPDFMEESEPSVEIIADVDGKEVSFRKFQKDSRTKKQKEAGAPVRISNQYEVNSVPVSQKDFIAKVVEYGINIDEFLLFTHPEEFTGRKSADCRKILFGMTTDVTDKQIADSMDNCSEASALLDNYTVEEITALQKRSKKEADQNLDNIPQQIIGMEKSKVQIDVQSLTEQKDALQTDIDNMESILKNNPLPDIGDLNEKISVCEHQMRILKTDANSQRLMKLSQANDALSEYKRQKVDAEYEYNSAIGAEEERKARLESLNGQYKTLGETFQKLKAQKFDESSNVCQFCGQPLPKSQADQNRKKFEAEIERQKLEINRSAGAIKKNIKELESHHVEIPSRDKIDELEKLISKKQAEVDALSVEVEVTGTDEYKKYEAEIQKVRSDIADWDEKSAEQRIMINDIAEKRIQLNHISDQLAQSAVNDHIDKQIEEVKQKQREYAQASANAEKILDQLSRISMEKNRLLTEQVNSHFDGVKFRLFEQLKNGDFRDCCVPLVPTADGEYRDITFSANTAAIVRGQLAIISGLQKFYGQNLPVFLDGAECLDAEHSKIETDFQLIMLKVSDDKNFVIA